MAILGEEEAAARAAHEKAAALELSLATRLRDATTALTDARAVRAGQGERLGRGEDVPMAENRAALAALRDAEDDVSLLQNGMRGAEDAAKAARTRLEAVLNAELKRRAQAAYRRAADAEAERQAADERRAKWDNIGQELGRARYVGGPYEPLSVDELDAALAVSEKWAEAAMARVEWPDADPAAVADATAAASAWLTSRGLSTAGGNVASLAALILAREEKVSAYWRPARASVAPLPKTGFARRR